MIQLCWKELWTSIWDLSNFPFSPRQCRYLWQKLSIDNFNFYWQIWILQTENHAVVFIIEIRLRLFLKQSFLFVFHQDSAPTEDTTDWLCGRCSLCQVCNNPGNEMESGDQLKCQKCRKTFHKSCLSNRGRKLADQQKEHWVNNVYCIELLFLLKCL